MSTPAKTTATWPTHADALLRVALDEDLGDVGDITTAVSAQGRGPASTATIRAKAVGRLSGLPLAARVFEMVDPGVVVELKASDGDPVEPGKVVLVARGSAASLLEAERTALNVLQRLSAVASMTARFVAETEGTRARIVDTRKTTPGFRTLEKAAVLHGGGHNHRVGLFDEVLLKENHFALAGALGYQGLVAKARAELPGIKVTAEAENMEEARAAADGGAHVILLDNFGVQRWAAAVTEFAKHPKRADFELEASGGVDLSTVGDIARTGVDRISVGALTHSAPALDLSMLLEMDSTE
ncbi:MAG: nicotinate-nucleotide diphosphorylase (carboxylating) [Planctomycetota bacterium]|nr:MAG: nicotinate-nucleotide diphosphorylase (carboxylating) [Planctomycetota bacterium]